jgi:hypothetical protein
MAEETEVVEKASEPGATEKNGSEQASKFIGNLFSSGRELDDQSAETASVNGADTEAGEKQDTEAVNDKAFLQMQIGDEDLNIDLNDDKSIKELHEKLEGQKLKLDSGEEFDLSDPEDVERLRNAGIPDDGEEEESPNVRELKFTKDGKEEVEKYDLSKKEDVDKLFKYASGGRLFEVERAGLNKEKEEFTGEKEILRQHAEYVGYSILNLVSSGKMTSKDFMELPFEDFAGASAEYDKEGSIVKDATDEGDRKLWNEHNTQAKKNKETMIDYEKGVKKMAGDFALMQNEFKTKHPEIDDVDKWVNENISPYHLPVVTYGKVSYPADTLEMIYFWKNREKIIEDAKKEGRRAKASVVIKRDKPGSKIINTRNGVYEKAVDLAKNIVSAGRKDVKIVH